VESERGNSKKGAVRGGTYSPKGGESRLRNSSLGRGRRELAREGTELLFRKGKLERIAWRQSWDFPLPLNGDDGKRETCIAENHRLVDFGIRAGQRTTLWGTGERPVGGVAMRTDKNDYLKKKKKTIRHGGRKRRPRRRTNLNVQSNS